MYFCITDQTPLPKVQMPLHENRLPLADRISSLSILRTLNDDFAFSASGDIACHDQDVLCVPSLNPLSDW
jgi:hypothetical protein